MSKFRKHPRKKTRRGKLTRNPLPLDRMFDRIVEGSREVSAPSVLYHYTTWASAHGILSSQQFWATSHACTNDEAELVTAQTTIIEVAEDLRKYATGVARQVLNQFIRKFSELQLTQLADVYLVCFSVAWDDENQWRKYADDGQGVCLGVRVLPEPGPTSPSVGTGLVRVDYSEPSWRDKLEVHFKKVISLVARAATTQTNINLGMSALYRIAAFASIMAKRPEWEEEQEFRLVTIVHHTSNVTSEERECAGRRIRYLPISVRAHGRLISFAEVIVGPNQNAEDGRRRLTNLLESNGYRADDTEYPRITVSQIPPWHHTT